MMQPKMSVCLSEHNSFVYRLISQINLSGLRSVEDCAGHYDCLIIHVSHLREHISECVDLWWDN